MTDSIQHPDDTQDGGKRFDSRLWRKLWSFCLEYRAHVIWLAFFAVTTAVFDAALPWVTKSVVDDLTDPKRSPDLWLYGPIYFGLSLGLALSVLGFITCGARLRTGVGHDIRRAGFENLQRLSFAYFDKRPVGWLMSRMTSDCERLTNILVWGLLDIVWGFTVMIGVALAMFIVDWRLALVLLAVVPVLTWVSAFFQKRILSSSRQVRKTNSQLTAAYNESIMGVRTTKAFVREEHNLSEFSLLAGEMNCASVRNALQSAVYLPIVLVLASLAAALTLGVGGARVISASIPLGTLVMFLAYSRLFFDPVQELARLFAEVQMAQASAERVVGLIEAQPEICDSPQVQSAVARAGAADTQASGLASDGLPAKVGTIEFKHVGFQYSGGQKVLDDFNLKVQAGETIALVGQTGGGKSTILSLLCRFYEPTSGRIEVDGIEYRERPLDWLQSNLGIVLQSPQLFSGSIADNIRYGDLDANEAAIQAAAELVGAHEFVMEMSEGYNTQVGEGGNRLSTGQKQLISFARAILAAPQILVMDEATSSIDTETERRIQTGLARVLAGRTSFVIAHRLSTIREADRILVIEHGRIVECGSHRELLSSRGRYHALHTQESLRSTAREQAGKVGPGVLPA